MDTILTSRLLLRPWADTDAERLYELARDPAIGPAAGWPPHTSVENSLEIIHTALGRPETYAVVLREIGLPIGSAGIFDTDAQGAQPGEPEIGYWIGRSYWGHGYAPEATQALIRRCFEQLGHARVWCSYFDGNEKSRRCQEKCGFRFHHTEPELYWDVTNEYKCTHFTCLTREDWRSGQNEQ